MFKALGGLGGLGDLAGMMQQVQQMGARMKELQARMAAQRVTGEADGGRVTVEMTGAQEVLAVRIDPDLYSGGDRERLETLVVAATNDALARAREAHAAALREVTGGMNLPAGVGEMLGRLGGGSQQ